MGVECAVIAGLFAIFFVAFLRAKRKIWALAMLPLLLVPLTDVVIEYLIISAMKINVTAFGAILALVIAVAISAAWIGFYAGKLDQKRYKATYIGITNAFNVALAAIIIADILSKVALDGNIPASII